MREIIITVGYPSSGKTTLCREYTKMGYTRINRDTLGGTLTKCAEILSHSLANGAQQVILDNTYGTAAQRSEVLKVAALHKVPVICLWLKTSIEDAQRNFCHRMMTMEGRILGPKEISSCGHPSIFSPVVLFAYRKRFEPPTMAEGFSSIEEVEFVRKNPYFASKKKAIVFDYDGTLRKTKSGAHYPTSHDDIEILPGRRKKLRELQDNKVLLLGMSNQSGVSKDLLTYEMASKCISITNLKLEVNIEARFCPHRSNPLSCWCRKPMPGMGVYFTHRHKLNPANVTMVGDMTSDKTFATRSGFKFVHADKFFVD